MTNQIAGGVDLSEYKFTLPGYFNEVLVLGHNNVREKKIRAYPIQMQITPLAYLTPSFSWLPNYVSHHQLLCSWVVVFFFKYSRCMPILLTVTLCSESVMTIHIVYLVCYQSYIQWHGYPTIKFGLGVYYVIWYRQNLSFEVLNIY